MQGYFSGSAAQHQCLAHVFWGLGTQVNVVPQSAVPACTWKRWEHPFLAGILVGAVRVLLGGATGYTALLSLL